MNDPTYTHTSRTAMCGETLSGKIRLIFIFCIFIFIFLLYKTCGEHPKKTLFSFENNICNSSSSYVKLRQ